MTSSGIPPLLPASPPPMCKDDFNEDEVDLDDYANEDDDEFGDFSAATSPSQSSKPPSTSIAASTSVPTILEADSSELSKNKPLDVKPISPNSSAEKTEVDEQKSDRVSPHSPETSKNREIRENDLVTNTSTLDQTSPVNDILPNLTFLCSPTNIANQNLCNEHVTSVVDEDTVLDVRCNGKTLYGNKSETNDSLSSSDSDSIDIPDDSFIICDETSVKNEADDSLSVKLDDKENDLSLSEFDVCLGYGSSSSKLDSHESGFEAFAETLDEKKVFGDPYAFVSTVEVETQNLDAFFQPFTHNSALLPDEKDSNLDFGAISSAKIAEQPLGEIFTDIQVMNHESSVEKIVSEELVFGKDVGEDDDFSDFVSPTLFVSQETVERKESDQISGQCDKFANIFEQNTSSVASQTFEWMEIFSAPVENHIEVNVNTIEGKLNCSSVWCKIKDIETSPALHYSWNNSETNKLLLAALCVDSRNILFGPRWSSEVPRFASNLGFTPLVPQKALEKSPQNECEFPDLSSDVNLENAEPFPELNTTMSSVPDAHFDWNNSGLTNPLDSYSHSSLLDLDLLASFDIHSPYYRKKRKPGKSTTATENYELRNSLSILNRSETKALSAEATDILNNLPDLIVMEKQYIVFPIH